MATTTKRSRSRSSSSSRTGGRGSRRTPRGGGGRKRPERPTPLRTRALAAFRRHVGEQSRDAAGLALVLLAVLVGLSVYVGAAGPVGDFTEAALRGLVGVYAFVVAPLLLWVGGMVLLGHAPQDVNRTAVGLTMTFVAAIGGWHLLAGLPEPADGIKELWPAGGVVGWAVSAPLSTALSPWGAGAVLLTLLFFGVLVTTSTPVARVIAAVRSLAPRRRRKDDAGGDTPDAGRPPRRSRRRGGGATVAEDPTATAATRLDRADGAEAERPRLRATLAGRRAEQPSLDGVDDGLSAADREAGRAPAPAPAGVPTSRRATKVAPPSARDGAAYALPPMDLLPAGRSLGEASRSQIVAHVEALQDTLDEFGIDAKVVRWSRGPTVTRFEIELGPGVPVKKVANLGDDIAYALAAPDVRIVAPIPGKSAIGVEVPNRKRDLITLGDILRSDEARRDPHPLHVALGVDIAGNPALVNLATMPHLLVSGATGSGKSVTLNAMITSVLMRARPDQVRMVLIDPKRVELNHYDGAPHLLSPVVTDPRRAADAVQWCVKEMEQRYEQLAQLGYRNIDSYNDAVDRGEVRDPALEAEAAARGEEAVYPRLPYILLVIDELADLMLVAPRDVEEAICRIAQMARAVGIHMVIATQRPSVDVITGLIKANIPSRLALAVASQTDSRTILDMNGAEKLVGHGDMLFLPASQGKPSRLQGCFVSEREIGPIIRFCKEQRQAEYVDEVVRTGEEAEAADAARAGDADSDEALLARAAAQVVDSGLGSVSMLQRKLRIGFARAGRLMDELEQLGCVGPNEGSKAREVLWSPEDLERARAARVFDAAFDDL